jgi:DNA-binding LacI/PurR family transcriptional regulator
MGNGNGNGILDRPSKHEQLFTLLRDEIRGGRYTAHDRLPSELQMKDSYGVSADTVRKGLSLLENGGLIYRVRYRGTFVAPRGKVDRILLVTHFSQDTQIDDFGVIYGIPSFERGMHSQCYRDRLDYSLVVMSADEYLERYEDLPLIHKSLAAVIFFRDPRGLFASREFLRKQKVPYLFYGADRHLERLGGDNVFLYGTQNLIDTALDYLTGKGHQRILFAGQAADDRYRCFSAKMQERGLYTGDLLVPTTGTTLQCDPTTLPGRCTAILGGSDRQAIVLLNTLVRAGISVPGQIAVLGIDNYPICPSTIIPLSSVDIPVAENAGTCLQLMHELLSGKRDRIDCRSQFRVVPRVSA